MPISKYLAVFAAVPIVSLLISTTFAAPDGPVTPSGWATKRVGDDFQFTRMRHKAPRYPEESLGESELDQSAIGRGIG